MTTVAAQTLPALWNFHEYQGDSWTEQFGWSRVDADGNKTPVDLTGTTIQSGVRSSIDETIALVAIIVDATNGIVAIQPPAGGLAADRYAYDVELTDSTGVVTTLVYGTLHIRGDVTP